MRIHQLPAVIANQIAAGEVIERPASVVKELLENAFDAGANSITVEIGYGGLNQIKVSDNGMGIVAEDLPLAVAAHATSKIAKLDDLYAIDSMGFRGEALASISSIAKMTISSRPAEQDHAMMLRIQGDDISISPCARGVGTTIDVVDLFFNAPVRKKFLKGEKIEFQAIETVVKRFALSAPTIAITLKHNNKLVLSLPPALNEQAKLTRLTKIFGSAFMKDAIYLNVDMAGMSLQGWVSGPGYQRSQNDRQWVYINQRMVKDKLINHALKQSYDGHLHPGRFPACLLYFSLAAADVDVNVHPTKHEVRFQQPRLIHDFFVAHLSKALGAANLASDVDYTRAADPVSGRNSELGEPVSYPSDYGLTTSYADLAAISRLNTASELPLFGKNKSSGLGGVTPTDASWIVLNNQFLFVFFNEQPYIVDGVALYQKWVCHQLDHANLPLQCRPLLVPLNYSVPKGFALNQVELKQQLAQLGIQVEMFSEDTVRVQTVPVILPYLDLNQLLQSIFALHVMDSNTLVALISKSQSFDLKYFTQDERMELNHFLFNSQNQDFGSQGTFKALTVNDCRKLLHV
ncbi:DNA mismatch repair endonuclease MutL [Legionella worsleiensis]|uniref:DNA mismatch repair protein MutL n=2 Tax=Legionella worsleiensis TaxID=45076 RepID=A0A0W1AF72_9GAMM|nr:DNA mismatch repair protein MutL [Legionella worsleiensis]STY32461.1 DNA mismatch repair protein MutL [Legionella worsleiensis]